MVLGRFVTLPFLNLHFLEREEDRWRDGSLKQMYFIADGGVNRLNYLKIAFKIIFFFFQNI